MTEDLASTRVTLLVRIRDSQDTEAWSQFARIYAPLIHRYALKHGLQDADAADLTQEVLRAVSGSIGRFEYDPQIGKFRSWLFTVARYTLNRLRTKRGRQPVGSGNPALMNELENLAESKEESDSDWDEEYEQRLFEWAADQIRSSFRESTWQAFWQTAVEGKKPKDVASELSMSVGSVYVAKNRVVSRLREKIQQIGER